MPRFPSSSSSGTIGTRPDPGKTTTSQPWSRSSVASSGSAAIGDGHQNGHLVRCLDQPARNRQPRRTVEHDPGWDAWTGRSSGQQGIVGEDRADAHDDRVHRSAELVDQASRGFRRDPPAVAGAGGGFAVESHRPFGGDVRAGRSPAASSTGHSGFGRPRPRSRSRPSIPAASSNCQAAAVHLRKWVAHARRPPARSRRRGWHPCTEGSCRNGSMARA